MAESTWRQAYTALLDTLRRAQEERDRRSNFIADDDGTMELGWVLYERQRMLDAVNALRHQANTPPITLDAVKVAETRACGHSDYTSKFAIGCADLVVAQ